MLIYNIMRYLKIKKKEHELSCSSSLLLLKTLNLIDAIPSPSFFLHLHLPISTIILPLLPLYDPVKTLIYGCGVLRVETSCGLPNVKGIPLKLYSGQKASGIERVHSE